MDWRRAWILSRSGGPGARRPKSARRLSIQYAITLAVAYLLAVVEAAAILIPLRGRASAPTDAGFPRIAVLGSLIAVAIEIGRAHV